MTMFQWLMLVCLCWICTSVEAERDIDANGILHVNEAWGLRPSEGSIKQILSSEFPRNAPPHLQQTWRYVTFPGSKLKVICNEIALPEGVRGKCGETVLELNDGHNKKEFCGTITGLTFMTITNDVTFELRTGAKGGGRVNCTVEARLIGPDGQEVTEPPTTTPPPPTLPSYLLQESVEIDSSEHGTYPGPKRTSCNCGWSNKGGLRIVGGQEVAVNEYPHMVGLVTQERPRWVFCGGSIVTQYHVLTAAHCTYYRRLERVPLAVLVGEHDYTAEAETNLSYVANVEEIIEHEHFDYVKMINDVSLLVLEKSIAFTSMIGPICLPTGRMMLDHHYVKSIGWGLTKHAGQMSNVLKKVNVRVVPTSECREQVVYGNPFVMCTYGTKKSTCQGDSGGPIMWLDPETNRYTLVGLVSYGGDCGGDRPMVNTDVTEFRQWLQHKIHATRPGARSCSKIR